MNRRDVIQRVVVGGSVLVLAPSILQSCSKDPSTDPGGNPNVDTGKIDLDLSLAANSVLNTPGGWLIVRKIIIINTGNGNYTALSSICTHQGCTVGYNSNTGNIQCPCHDSVYTTSGNVITGPAESALKSYVAQLAGNILTISL